MKRSFKVRRCRYCRRAMQNVSAASYEENPWCVKCLPERIAKAAARNPVVGWEDLGNGFTKPVFLSDVQGRDRN